MQKSRSSIAVIVPARNEENTVGQIVKEVINILACDVIVVDDASEDQTTQMARQAGAHVLPLRYQQGAWGAIRTGIRYAYLNNYEVAVTIDADGQHPPQAIGTVIAPVIDEKADVVIGACTARGSRARKVAWHFFRKLTMLHINDLTSGFRSYNRKAIETLIAPAVTLFDYQDIGVLLYLQESGLVITEVEVNMCPRISGHSRIFATWANVFKYLIATLILSIARIK